MSTTAATAVVAAAPNSARAARDPFFAQFLVQPRYVDCRSVQTSFRRCAIVVLLTGASGFIGSRIGVDAVINAVGILRERDTQTFEALHVAAPCALFEACAQSRRVRRVLQISALRAEPRALTPYHRSKAAVDAFLLHRLPLRGVVVQPSLVYGAGGASARLFTLLATLPLLPLPGGGHQTVQPLHVDDAVQVVLVGGWRSASWPPRADRGVLAHGCQTAIAADGRLLESFT